MILSLNLAFEIGTYKFFRCSVCCIRCERVAWLGRLNEGGVAQGSEILFFSDEETYFDGVQTRCRQKAIDKRIESADFPSLRLNSGRKEGSIRIR